MGMVYPPLVHRPFISTPAGRDHAMGCPPVNQSRITIIDETLREGMQHRGIVFSKEQRKTILEFQEALRVDICQAGYPPAHDSEIDQVRQLHGIAQRRGYTIRIAGMGRALPKDTVPLIAAGISDFHLHAHIPGGASGKDQDKIFSNIASATQILRQQQPGASISLAMLDIGKTDPGFLADTVDFLVKQLKIDIISLPDTSGILAPQQLSARIKPIADNIINTSSQISVHCHNDMGMASANTIMGIHAGALVVEASVMGIGERNGIADLFVTGKMLKDLGFNLRLNTDDIDTFKAYYSFINTLCLEQTGEALMTYNTPFFGNAVKTHVAGTHSDATFGISHETDYYLNLLCSKGLVKNYLNLYQIPYHPEALVQITSEIKDLSATLGRSLKKEEISAIAKCR